MLQTVHTSRPTASNIWSTNVSINETCVESDQTDDTVKDEKERESEDEVKIIHR